MPAKRQIRMICRDPRQRLSSFARAPPRRGAKPMQPSARAGCADVNEHCAVWAESGECDRNTQYMHANCARSCDTC
eukprot:6188778-Pleurochrysis_carterae.AAC.1